MALAFALALALAPACGTASLKQDSGATGQGGNGGGSGNGSGGAASDAAMDAAARTDAGTDTGNDAPPMRDAADASGASDTNTDVAVVVDSGAADAGACARPRTCAILHACNPSLISGPSMIFPDGAADAGLVVHCDMETAGGGWTVIYLANSIILDSTAIEYTVPAQSLRDTAQEALIAYRNLNLNMLASNWASFGLPATWRTKNPLAVAPFEDLTVSAAVNGALPALALLRYGQANFGSLCSDPWISTGAAPLYGRVCLQGTTATFFSGFTVAGTDLCALSNQAYNARTCDDSARFSIAVR